MAVIVVTADNNRVEDAESGTGWSNIESGPAGSSEEPFAYQGSNLFNRKVTSATGAGFFYAPTSDSGSAVDMTVTGRKTWMIKIMVSDYGGLDATDGVLVRIGSGTSNYYAFVLAGTDGVPSFTDQYRPVGGLLVIPVDPNENAAYNDTGKDATAPTLTAIDYFGGVFAFSTATAKNENCGLDAIDVGSGLYMVGGDSADPDGVWQDFVDHDEGTVSNRFGYMRNADGGGILAYGNLRIGEDSGGAVATVFDDSAAIITWLDHMAAAGFSVVSVNLSNATTDVQDGSLHLGIGTSSDVDSRPDYIVTGTSGSATFTHTLRNFRNVTLTLACTETGEVECVLLTQGDADIEDAIIRTNQLTNMATIVQPFLGINKGLHDTLFVQSGVGHALEIDTAATYTFTGITFSGYGGTPGSNLIQSSGAADAALVNSSGGEVTILVSGGDQPSVRNTGGSTTVVDASVTIEINGVTEGARVVIERTDTDVELLNELAFIDDGQGAFKASGSFAFVSDTPVRVSAASSGKPVAAASDNNDVFTDETVNANSASTLDMTLLPASPVATEDGYVFGHTEQFGQMDLVIDTVGTGGFTITWEYWNGSAWTALSGVSDGTSSYTNLGTGRVSWTIPGGWTARTISSQPGSTVLFYIRASFSAGSVTILPVGRQVTMDVTKYLRWEDINTVTSTGLAVKATWIIDTIASF